MVTLLILNASFIYRYGGNSFDSINNFFTFIQHRLFR